MQGWLEFPEHFGPKKFSEEFPHCSELHFNAGIFTWAMSTASNKEKFTFMYIENKKTEFRYTKASKASIL